MGPGVLVPHSLLQHPKLMEWVCVSPSWTDGILLWFSMGRSRDPTGTTWLHVYSGNFLEPLEEMERFDHNFQGRCSDKE